MSSKVPLIPNASDQQLLKLEHLSKLNIPNLIFGEFKAIEIESEVKYVVREALNTLDNRCVDCTGDHSKWIVAGGYATFKLGHTDKFSDIDIFVCCNGAIKYHEGGKHYPFHNVVNLNIGRFRAQLIQVFFDYKVHEDVTKFIDMMSLHVLTRFDLPLCRVAVRFPLDQLSDTYVIDLSSIDNYKNPRVDRLTKYENRKVLNDIKQVPSLKLLAAAAFFSE